MSTKSRQRRRSGSGPRRGRKPTKSWSLYTLAALIIGSGALFWIVSTPWNADGPEAMVLSDMTEVRLPLSDLDDGQARFFAYDPAAGAMGRFLALRAAEGRYEAALDTCPRCLDTSDGFRQAGTNLICRCCGVSTPVAEVGFMSGECRPIIIPSTVLNGMLRIDPADARRAATLAAAGAEG